MNAVLSEKGQITIPKSLRDSLGLRTGVVLEFTEESGTLVGRKVLTQDSFEKWRGKGNLPKDLGVDEYLEQARGNE